MVHLRFTISSLSFLQWALLPVTFLVTDTFVTVIEPLAFPRDPNSRLPSSGTRCDVGSSQSYKGVSSKQNNTMSSSSFYSYILSVWKKLWQSLGLSQKEGTLLLLGLDNAGKTTLLHRLKTGSLRTFPPTDRPHRCETFVQFGIRLTAWDLGGHEAVRHLWQDYVCDCNAVLFLLDAADTERTEEAGYELDALLGDGVLEGLPVAILLNKCDLVEEAMDTETICQRIGYEELAKLQQSRTTASDRRMMNVFRISVLQGEGYPEAFRWIAQFL